MAANKTLNIQPQFIPNAAGNLLNCNITSLAGPVGFTMTQPYILISHMRVTNNDASAHVITTYKGATGGSAAGTAVAFDHLSIAGGAYADWYGKLRLDAADFLSGVCDSASKCTIEIDAEIGVSG